MGQLKPNAALVYERVDNMVYAREAGSDPATRKLVGYSYDPITGHRIDYNTRTADGRLIHDTLIEDKMWGDIRRAARTNPTLHDALERAIVIYNLSKENE